MTGMARSPLDRSAAFTALLELDPEGFAKSSDPESTKTITTFLEDFRESGATNLYTYCREWLDARDDQVLETVRQVEEGQGAEAVPPAPETGVPEDPDKPWQVTAQVHRSVDGWQSSRQVPAFTIPRALAYSKEDAEAKAREIINPYGEPYDIHMEVTTDYVTPERQPEAECQDMGAPPTEAELAEIREASEAGEPAPDIYEPEDMRIRRESRQKALEAEAAREAADAEAWGPRGPSASYAEWLAEGREDSGREVGMGEGTSSRKRPGRRPGGR